MSVGPGSNFKMASISPWKLCCFQLLSSSPCGLTCWWVCLSSGIWAAHEIEFAGSSKWEISEDSEGGKLQVEVMNLLFLFCLVVPCLKMYWGEGFLGDVRVMWVFVFVQSKWLGRKCLSGLLNISVLFGIGYQHIYSDLFGQEWS